MMRLNIKSVRTWVISLALVASAGGVMLTMALPQTVAAADKCNLGFLGFPAWYRGLTDDKCDIISPEATENGLSNFIWHIGLNILEIALVVVAYLSGFYFLYGGFLFITSQGKPEGAAKARSTMLESLVGLIISFAAISLVNFIVDKILG